MKSLLGAALALVAIPALWPATASAHSCGDPFETELIASGGNPKSAIEVGIVRVCSPDAETVRITYKTFEPWCLRETHVHVASEPEEIPQRNGNPVPGQFDESEVFGVCAGEATYDIPVSEIDGSLMIGDTVYVAAHAVVYNDALGQEETAWGKGPGFPGRNWATYFTYVLQEPGPTVEPGPPPNFSKGLGVRYRSFANTGASEIYLGVGNLGAGTNRVERQFNWVKPGTYNITLTYDPSMDSLTTTVEGTGLVYSGVTNNLAAKTGCTVQSLDRAEIVVSDRDTGSQVDFLDVILDGFELGDFAGQNNFSTWSVTDYDFSQGFEVSGKVVLSGPFSGGQERSRVEFLVGCAATP